MALRFLQMYQSFLDDSNVLSPTIVMDTLHVTPSSSSLTSSSTTAAAREQHRSQHQHSHPYQQHTRKGSSSVRSSRSPSANRSAVDQMSRERERESAEPSTSSSTVGLQSVGISGSGGGGISGCSGGGGSSSSAATGGTVTSGGAGVTATSAVTGSGGGGGGGGSGGGGGGGGGGGSGGISGSASGALRFRNQSPSNRRSRERNRREFNRSYGSDQGGLLAYGELQIEPMGSMEDSRLSGNEDLCYQSFASDEPDGNPLTLSTDTNKKHHRRHERTTSLQAIDRLNTKIQCTKESIRKEQTARDDNVNEYLKLAASADKQQLQRIKAVFEKKNQKSAHTIAQLQKKLDSYTKRAKDLQNHQYHNKSQHRQPREVLRDVGQGLRNVGGNIRDGITGFSGSVMSKPREFAHLIKNKFGSADNINQMTEAEINALNMPVNASEVIGTPNNAVTLQAQSTGSGNTGGAGSGKFNSDNGSECSSVTSESIPAGSGKSQSGASQYNVIYKTILTQLQERNDELEKLKERVERLENTQKEFNNLTATLETERYRAEGLEEQINDLTELHQNEIENLKQAIADMEEKVQYQSDERLRDVNEVLENCQTRISKMEHLSQQQYVTVEGIDNSNARALVVKLINVVLTVLQVVLLLVATAAGIIMPFLKTRVRVLTTFFSICFIIFVIRQWPDVKDIGSGLVRHLKESLVVK